MMSIFLFFYIFEVFFLDRGPPRFEGDRPRFGDRDGYRGGPRPGGPSGELGDKGGAPPEFQPSFRVYILELLKIFFFTFFQQLMVNGT